jgi:putative ABC transport system ATP-binding protein
MAAIVADDLYRFYHTGAEETRALRGVTFAVESGELVALIGPSGSGKSTLLSCLGGLDVPDGGQVVLMGERISRLSEIERAERRRAHLGMLMQSQNLFSGLTAEENVRIALLIARRKNKDRVAMLLDLVGMSSRRGALPRELSGGETARVALATALVAEPDVLLADEPTAEVDKRTEADIVRLLRQYCESGMAAIVATHSPSLRERASRVIVLADGRIRDDTGPRAS